MTSDETSADVIEAAAKVLREMTYTSLGWESRHGEHYDYRCPWCRPDIPDKDGHDGYHRIAAVLADSGLLADPADRYEPYDQLDNQRNLWAKQCHEAETRAERAEAEVARLGRLVDENSDRLQEEPAELAELRATVERVRALADEWERANRAGLAGGAVLSLTYANAKDRLRKALDGGEQS